MENVKYPWAFHSPLIRAVKFKLHVKAEEPLAIRQGKEIGGALDNPVIKVRRGKTEVPILPGSSLKGVLRSFAEAIWSSLIGASEPYHWGPYSKGCTSCAQGPTCKEWFNEAKRKLSASELSEAIAGFCPVCLTFGAHSYRSKLKISTFYPIEYSLSVRTFNQINRKTGVAQHPHQVEFVEPDSTFEGSLELVNAPNWSLFLIGHLLNLTNMGMIKVGSLKSRGFGRISVSVVDASVVEIRDGKLRNLSLGDVLEPLDEDVDAPFELTTNLSSYSKAFADVSKTLIEVWGVRRERAMKIALR